MYLGVDIGSSSSKAVILDKNGDLVGEAVINIGTGSSGSERVIKEVLRKAGLNQENIRKTVVTGYGRMTFKNADKQVTEISCHAKGVHEIFPTARTIIDIGGQDAKVINLSKRGTIDNFAMNEKCAAGTGRFLEVMARVLDCRLQDLSTLAEKSKKNVAISSMCTVFAESEVISQLAEGANVEDVALGAHKAIAERVEGLCKRVGVLEDVVMTGGVALNANVVQALEKLIGVEIKKPKNPQSIGAFGAAIYARELDNK